MMRLNTVLFLLLTLQACHDRPTPVSREELAKYIGNPENGVLQTVVSNGLQLQVAYHPKDLILDLMRTSSRPSEWDSLEKSLIEFDYFTIRFSRENREIETYFANDPGAYRKLTDYLNGLIAGDLHLRVDNETIEVDQVIYTPHYGMANYTTVMVVFKSGLSNRKNDFTVTFNDSFVGSGRASFGFSFKEIRKIPRLYLNTSI